MPAPQDPGIAGRRDGRSGGLPRSQAQSAQLAESASVHWACMGLFVICGGVKRSRLLRVQGQHHRHSDQRGKPSEGTASVNGDKTARRSGEVDEQGRLTSNIWERVSYIIM